MVPVEGLDNTVVRGWRVYSMIVYIKKRVLVLLANHLLRLQSNRMMHQLRSSTLSQICTKIYSK